MTDAAPHASANRVEYQRGPLTQWYVNGPLGLEQGFTLGEAPSSGRGQPLTIALAISGDGAAKVDAGGSGLTLSGRESQPQLRYTGLTAHDADGRDLCSWMEVRGDRLLLKVADASARYPVVVDPFVWAQLAELTASDGASGYALGWSVAVSGSTVVVGEPGATIGSHSGQGAVYVFVEPAGGWANMTQTAKLTASDGGKHSSLGLSVAISGNTVVAGGQYAVVGSNEEKGAAYVFSKPAGGWADMTQTSKLVSSDEQPGDGFGVSVAISNGTVVVGAPLVQAGGDVQVGAAYVFVQANGGANRTETAKLTAADAWGGQFLGESVAISGNTIVVGATDNNYGANPEGSVYVFVQPAGGWSSMTSTAELTSTETSNEPKLGYSVAISGNTVVAGAPYASIGNNNSQGTAYLWVEPAGGWIDMTETAKLYASNGQSNDNFGFSVAISGNTVVVGAPSATVGERRYGGGAYIFIEPTTGWVSTSSFKAELHASNETTNTYFSNSIAISGNTLIVGASNATIGSNVGQGATYVFRKSQ